MQQDSPSRYQYTMRSLFEVGASVSCVLASVEAFSSPRKQRAATSFSSAPHTRATQDNDAPIGLYIHIPYCRRRCRYCDFAIVPIGDNNEVSLDRLNVNYTRALLQELEWINDYSSRTGQQPLRSVYFGGGTPSLAPIETIQTVLDHVPVSMRNHCEITMEIDPGTFTEKKLQSLKDLGINRLSFGVQSFDDTLLNSMGRVHRVEDVWQSLRIIRDVYGDAVNYSIDLISGLPGLTMAKWIETLSIATSLDPRPKHISIYDLQIERGTVFDSWYGNRPETSGHVAIGSDQEKLQLPSQEVCAMMYKYASGYLKSKGYEHYEVSSYALTLDDEFATGYRSRHNQLYWDVNGQWFAVGLGATSSIGGRTVARPRTFVDYLYWVESHKNNKEILSVMTEPLPSDVDVLQDIVLKRLRTIDGLSLVWVEEKFGSLSRDAVIKGVELAIDLGLASINDEKVLALSDPDGLLFSSSIISSIFVEIESLQEKSDSR